MRKFLANVVFLFFGLPLVLGSLALISVRPWVLDRGAYERIVRDERLYAALRAPEMASRAPESIELELGPEAGGKKLVLDGSAAAAALQKDLPWPEIQETAARGVNAAMDAVARGASGAPAELDLRPLKAALKAKAPAVARDYAAGLGAEAKAGTAAKGATAVRPELLQAALARELERLPDAARIEPPPPPRGPRGLPLGVVSRGGGLSQALLNRMTATSAAMSALLLAGLGALGGRSLLAKLSRAGRYLLIPSILVLALGAVLAVPGGLILQNLIPGEARAMLASPGGALLRDYLASVLGPIAKGFFVTGLVGASLGGVLASSRKFGDRRELEGSERKELD